MIRIRRGLDVPLAGPPLQKIDGGPTVRRVAVLGEDFIGMKPTMEVQVGDRVKTGQLLFTDKKTPGLRFTSPGCGTVVEINRGEKRAFQSVVIELDGDGSVRFNSYTPDQLPSLPRDEVANALVEAGLWPSFRTRPYSKVPRIDAVPHAIFVTATDTHPLCGDPKVVLAHRQAEFRHGLQAIRRLTEGPVFLCAAPETELPEVSGVQRQDFSGPHPSGLVGTHIHFLRPAHAENTVWHLGYQDVIAIGHLLVQGELLLERIVSLAGPGVKNPRLVRTRLGVSTEDLTRGEIEEENLRVVSGSALAGRDASGPVAYLGRYHQQVTVLPQGGHRLLFGWTQPGANHYSINRTFLSRYLPAKLYPITTALSGSHRAIVPIGSFEKVMPLDLEPVYLLRALAGGDTDEAQALGCLELDEEDLALCTFVCNGKNDYGPMLRSALTTIEKEG